MFQNIPDSLQMLRGYLKVDLASISTKLPLFTPADERCFRNIPPYQQ